MRANSSVMKIAAGNAENAEGGTQTLISHAIGAIPLNGERRRSAANRKTVESREQGEMDM